MPDMSVIQGSKMSSLLYTLFTIDTVQYHKIMKNKEIYKLLMGKELENYNIESTQYLHTWTTRNT